jgi:hypothetical protein
VDVDQAEDGNPTRFIFNGNDWVHIGQTLEVAALKARENLVLAQPGHIAHLPNGDTIYTGNEWIDLGETYRVNNLAERNALNVQPGDLVKVADTGNGRHDAFLYADGQWIKQVRVMPGKSSSMLIAFNSPMAPKSAPDQCRWRQHYPQRGQNDLSHR